MLLKHETLRKVDQKYLGSFEMWCYRSMEMISWTDRVGNEEVLHRVKEEREQFHFRPGQAPRVPGGLRLPDFTTVCT